MTSLAADPIQQAGVGHAQHRNVTDFQEGMVRGTNQKRFNKEPADVLIGYESHGVAQGQDGDARAATPRSLR